jgi:hypothetical protein
MPLPWERRRPPADGEQPPAAPSFSSTYPVGLRIDVDADLLLANEQTPGELTAWLNKDEGGNGYEWTAVSGGQAPFYFDSDPPYVEFGGTGANMDSPALAITASPSEWTIFVVANPDTSGTTARRLLTVVDDAGSGRVEIFAHTSTGLVAFSQDPMVATYTYGAAATGLQLLTFALGTASQRVWRNGTALTADGSPAFSALSFSDTVKLCANSLGGASFDGKLYRLMAYARLLTDEEILFVQTALRTRYGL